MKNKSQIRANYVNKIRQEFKSKGWDFQRALGRKDIRSTIKNAKSYEAFKKSVREARSYFKEREKIREEMKVIRGKREQQRIAYQRKQKQSLVDLFGKGQTTKLIWQRRDELGLNKLDFFSKKTILKKVADKFKEDITQEIKMDRGTPTEKTVGAVFKNVSEDDFVEEQLNDLFNIVKKDDKAMENIYKATDYLYGTIIKNKYEGRNAEYSRIRKADEVFWRDVGKELTDYYKKLVR